MRFHSPLLALVAACVLFPLSSQDKPVASHEKGAKKSTLDIAKSLATEKFKDATYGHEGTKGQVDDASFVVAVLDGCGAKLDTATKESILKLGKLGADAKEAQSLVEKKDAQLGGVADLLIKGKLAKKVELADVQIGDFIQYWKKNDKNEWYGYAFVIESVEKDAAGKNPKVKLFGAHEGNAKIGKSGPVGSSRFDLVLKEDDDRRIFLARLDASMLGKDKPENATPPVKDPAKKDPPKKDPPKKDPPKKDPKK